MTSITYLEFDVVHRHNNLPSPPREISDIAQGSVRPKNICRLLNRQPQLPHRTLTEKHPQWEFCAMVRQIFIYTKEEVQKMDSSTLNPKNEDCPDMKENVKETKGLVKILKKYDKRTGALIRQPFIEKVLQQPFFTTDLLYKLVKECAAMLDHHFPSNNLSISAECD
ncbi:hypothetical protein ZIOFF_028175 [Zingiber officinale]|uniref:SPX domain-containing protein n=1 Tax=Zingiber officinale TaxID=94328 RepID=A0A8J5GUL6_ZINOF|nr:hypothetical protein ZIOFF_028175 [Zingiber officinale]